MKILLVLLGLLFPALALPAAAADAKVQDAILQEVNAFRASAGLAPVRLEPRLSRAAEQHSRDMLARNVLSHQGSDGSDPGARIARAGYRWRSYRENVGAGYMTMREAVAGWVQSPEHRANLLAPDVTQVGVGFAGGPGMMAGNIPRTFWTLVLAAPR